MSSDSPRRRKRSKSPAKPEQSNSNQALLIVLGAVGGVFVLGVFGFGILFALGAWAPRTQPSHPSSALPPMTAQPQSAAANQWPTHKLVDISLQAPANFAAATDLMPQLPEVLRANFEHSFMHVAGQNTDFQVLVGRAAYVPGTEVDLHAAATNGIQGAAKALGDPNPKFNIHDLTVQNRPAVRGTYRGNHNGQPFRIELLAIHDGLKLFQVSVISQNADKDADIDRILSSVQI